jgi:hypothetical protein
MIGRQFPELASHPPKRTVNDPSGLGFAVRLLREYMFCGFFSKKPLSL